MTTKQKREIERGIQRMRRTLETFNKLDSTDRWYVLTRIAQKDDPAIFAKVAHERIMP